MHKKVLPINKKINGIKKRLPPRNLIIEGVKKSPAVILRGDYARTLIWTAMSEYGEPVEVADLIDVTQCSYDQVKSWLDVWAKYGYLSKTMTDRIRSKTGGKRFLYEVVKSSNLPPPIDLKGRQKPPEHRQYIWDAVRIFSAQSLSFTIADLIESISNSIGVDVDVDVDYAQSYLRDLYHACYLDSTQHPQQRMPIYFMIYDTGPFAPSVRRGKSIFDPNLGVIVN